LISDQPHSVLWILCSAVFSFRRRDRGRCGVLSVVFQSGTDICFTRFSSGLSVWCFLFYPFFSEYGRDMIGVIFFCLVLSCLPAISSLTVFPAVNLLDALLLIIFVPASLRGKPGDEKNAKLTSCR
jgi:hypothetical protein